jgi:YVTN family beta-propeller protein
VTPDGKLLLSADRDSDSVSVIDATTNQRLKSIAVGKRPFGVTIDSQGRRAFTANVASDDVSVIDIADGKVVATVAVGHRPYAVALAQGRAFVTNQYGDSVSVIDLKELNVVKTIDVGDHPEGIAADPREANVYVACWFDNVLMRIDPQSLAVTGQAPVGDGPRAFGAFLR